MNLVKHQKAVALINFFADKSHEWRETYNERDKMVEIARNVYFKSGCPAEQKPMLEALQAHAAEAFIKANEYLNYGFRASAVAAKISK